MPCGGVFLRLCGVFGARPGDKELLDFHQLSVKLGNTFSPAHLVNRLQRHPEFVMRFADRAQRLFFNDGALTVARAQQRWRELAETLDTAIVAEAARWGDCNREAVRGDSEFNGHLLVRGVVDEQHRGFGDSGWPFLDL